jgi:hypothetical protein
MYFGHVQFNGTPRTPWQTQPFPMRPREELCERERGVDPDVRLWDAWVLTFLSRGVRWLQVCLFEVMGSPVSACSRGRRDLQMFRSKEG